MRKIDIKYSTIQEDDAPMATRRKDGTSQQTRRLKALDAGYFLPEDRDIKDWLNYLRTMASLVYYKNSTGDDTTWESFLASPKMLDTQTNSLKYLVTDDDILQYIEDPASLASYPDKVQWLSRPHFILLVTFLKLLRHAREKINDFTQRHLDFYYREVLSSIKRAPVMDQVHVLVSLERGEEHLVLNKGTLLNAGRNPASDDNLQATLIDNFFINNATLGDFYSLFLDKEIFDLQALRQKYRSERDQGISRMFIMVYPELKTTGNVLPTQFFLPEEEANELVRIRQTDAKDISEQDWSLLYELLAKAYDQQQIEARQQEIKAVKDEAFNMNMDMPAGASQQEQQIIRARAAFDEVMKFVAGDPLPGDPLPPYASSLSDILTDINKGRSDLHEAYLRDELFLQVRDFINLMDLEETTDETKWKDGYGILERIMRQKRRIGVIEPSVEEWYNLYKAPDAKTIRTTPVSKGWKPFGMEGSGEKVPLGIMVESPVLNLAEGKRTIIVQLFFLPDGFNHLAIEQKHFSFQLSTTDGFFTVPDTQVSFAASLVTSVKANVTITTAALIRATITLNEKDSAIVPPASSHHEASTLKVVLREELDGEDLKVPYTLYKDLMLNQVKIDIEVQGLKKMIIENDEAILDSKKPFEPFGTSPQAGSRFYFFNREIATKRIDTLLLNFSWMGLPANLNTHYAGYQTAVSGNDYFNANLLLTNNDVERKINKDDSKIRIISPAIIGPVVVDEYRTLPDGEQEDVRSNARYFCLELNTGFLQDEYPVAAAKGMARTKNDGEKVVPDPLIINPPYTPKLKSFTLNYTSHAVISPSDQREGCIYYLHPFGLEQLVNSGTYKFLPLYEDEGALFISLENMQAPDTVSLLFQFVPRSADPAATKPAVSFSYLTTNGWKNLDTSALLLDTTENLSHTGIIQLALPADATDASLMMPAGRYWLRFTVANNSAGIHDLEAIHIQAVEARMQEQGSYTSIPAETIQTTVDYMPVIKSLLQPFPSFGGRPEEDSDEHYVRISEQLRHKQRAAASWDYERLVLQQFPAIYKAKALSADDANPNVRIMVIPRRDHASSARMFEPRLSQAELQEIEHYLSAHASPFAGIQVMNPRYQAVKVRTSVRLRNGYNELYAKEQINDAIRKYLSPWAFETTNDMDLAFGGEIYASDIANLIEQQPCVNYVLTIRFFTDRDGAGLRLVPPQGTDKINVVQAVTADAILVSAEKHDIDILHDDRIDFDDLSGIGYMKVATDFIVS